MIFIYSTHACMQVHKNACLAPSDSPEYHAPVHAVVGMAGQGLSHNRASRAFFCVWMGGTTSFSLRAARL